VAEGKQKILKAVILIGVFGQIGNSGRKYSIVQGKIVGRIRMLKARDGGNTLNFFNGCIVQIIRNVGFAFADHNSGHFRHFIVRIIVTVKGIVVAPTSTGP